MVEGIRQSPSPEFIQSIQAGISYWQELTYRLSPETMVALDRQRQNLYRLVQFGLKRPETQVGAATIALQAFDLVEQRGYWLDWAPIMQQAITGCKDERPHLKFKLLNRLGQLHRLNRQLDSSVKTHQAAEAIAQQLNDKQLLAEAHYNLSETYLRQHEYDEAERYGLAALSTFSNLKGVNQWLSAVLNTLGEISRFRGDLAVSETRLARAVDLARVSNQSTYLVRFLNNLFLTLQAAERYDEALACLTEAAVSLGPAANDFDYVMIQINLGLLHFKQQQWHEAEAAFRQANSPYLQRSGHIYYQALIANNLGNTLLKQHRFNEAESYLRRAMRLWKQANDDLELANTVGTLAEVLTAQSQFDEAIILYTEAIALLKQFPDNAWAQQLLNRFTAQSQKL